MTAFIGRREFITLLGGAAAWPSVASAQTARKRPIIGTFVQGTPTQNKGLGFRQSFLDGLRELGDIQGRDFDIVIQPAGSTSDLPKAAEQLRSRPVEKATALGNTVCQLGGAASPEGGD